jgi:hypothetical protein
MGGTSSNKFYWSLWCVTTVLAGILAGYMVSHSIMLARFFDWYIASDNMELLRRTYTIFRNSSNANRMYDIPLLLSLIFGTAWTMLAFALKRDRMVTAIAGLSTVWVTGISLGTDLGEAGTRCCRGRRTQRRRSTS